MRLNPGPGKIGKSPKTGLEITVFLGEDVLSTRWFSLPATVGVGDSTRFDVFCPLTEVTEIAPAQRARLISDGYLLKPVNGAESVGAILFSPGRDGRVSIRVPDGLRGRLDGPAGKSESPLSSGEWTVPFCGEIQGAGPWRLRFVAEPVPVMTGCNRLSVPGYFIQSLLFGFTFLFGLLGLGFLQPGEFEWDQVAGGSHRRLAVMNRNPQKAPPKVVDEPVAARLQELRIAPRKTQTQPRQRVVRPASPRLLSAVPKSPIKLDSGRSDANLVDPDAAAEPVDLTPSLDEPGSPVPAVPVPPAITKNVQPAARAVVTMPRKQAVPVKRLSFPPVDYPEGARHLGLEGKVKLKLYIDSTGKVVKVEVLAGLHPLLDRAAENGARSARYEPARDTQGRPMDSTATVTVRFELEEE